jgi:hypothetical protein
MNTLAKIGLIFLAIVAAIWAGGIVLGIVSTILHWVFLAAIVGGVGYVVYAIAAPRKALGWRSRILP